MEPEDKPKPKEKDIKRLSKDMSDLRKGLNEIYSAIKENSPSAQGDYEFREFLVYDLERVIHYLKRVVRKNPFNEPYNHIGELVMLIDRMEYLINVLNSKN